MPVYANTLELSAALEKRAAGATPRKLKRYAYNRHDSRSTWWLVDSGAHVNRNQAKLEVGLLPGSDEFFVGWGVEKGLTLPPEDPTPRRPEREMDERWPWHALHRDAVSGELLPTVREAVDASAQPLLLQVSFWPHEEHDKKLDRFLWKVDREGTVTLISESQKLAGEEHAMLSRKLTGATTLARVFTLLPYTEEAGLFDRMYGDISFGRAYPVNANLDPERVFRESMEPWLRRL